MIFNLQYLPNKNINQNNYRIMFFHRHLDQIIYSHYLINNKEINYHKLETDLNCSNYYKDQFLNQLNQIYSLINYWLKTGYDWFLTSSQINLITIILNHIPINNNDPQLYTNKQSYFDWMISALINNYINLDLFIIICNYYLIKNNIASLFSFDKIDQIKAFKTIIKTKNVDKIKQAIWKHCFDFVL